MSELEILRRKEYKRNRKKWLLIQATVILLLAAMALGAFWVYNRMNQTYYVEYTEKSGIDYKVRYIPNDYFESEWIEKDQAYISSLINGMTADFTYDLVAGRADMGFSYKYQIDQQLLIANKDTGAPYYTAAENIVPLTSADASSGYGLQIKDTVLIDYEKYDEIAREFVDTYNLKNASCTLIVTLDVTFFSANQQFALEGQNRYTTSLNIPLAEDTFHIHTTASSPAGEIKTFAYKDVSNRGFYLVAGIVTASLTGVLAVVLLVFIHLTKNEDITYAAKIRKILNAYGSFIQRMNGEFDCQGYQVVSIMTFTEMLGIRDTIQAPILMSENRDETMTRFFIPTDTNLLYVFDIKVDNYDEIYEKDESALQTV